MGSVRNIRVEDGIVVGTSGDKYNSRNPIYRFLVNQFERSIENLVTSVSPNSFLEIGCGEGHITRILLDSTQSKIHATDISLSVLKETKKTFNTDRISWEVAKLETYQPIAVSDMVVCCEVLEHLTDPILGLQALSAFGSQWYLLSVPREPLWRILNMMRCAYLKDFGNSPGHIQHWSKSSFVRLVIRYFDIIKIMSPIPWTVLLCRNRTITRTSEYTGKIKLSVNTLSPFHFILDETDNDIHKNVSYRFHKCLNRYHSMIKFF